ncbi:MAG TPA: DUF2339 domain-containing protein [Rubrobacteraceae bacterium]|nr:DUF2339 domain-containing protein [Rubrobacteraceae bacterium]
MQGPRDAGLMERLAALEAEVERQGCELRGVMRRLDLLAGKYALADGPPHVPERTDAQERGFSDVTRTLREKKFRLPLALERLRSGEWWLNRVGIGLLLLGAVFLFKFSVDRDWITPPVRVGFGLALGALLVTLGLRVYAGRRSFSQVLLGGGVGVFYITGYAAFELYALVPYPAAFSFMVMVTLMAFTLALRQNGVALALIGALGGFGTPLLLYDSGGSVSGLVLYITLVLAGACAIYLYRGWRSLLMAAFAGVWTVLLIGSWSLPYPPDAALSDRLALQVGAALAWSILWVSAMGREVLRDRAASRRGSEHSNAPAHAISHAICIAAPLAALAYTREIWDLQGDTLGWISLGAATLYALASTFILRMSGGGLTYYTQAAGALVLATLSLVLLLDGDALLVALAAEGAALHYVARRLPDRLLAVGANALLAIALACIFTRPLWDYPLSGQIAVFNTRSLSDLAVITLAFAATFSVTAWRAAIILRLAAHAALLAWFWRELSVIPGGEPYVTIAWGLYAAALLVAGLRLDSTALARTGMATLFLVVGKLFLFDLAGVEAVWRILLFLGFGGLFLGLSYYLHSLWRPKALDTTQSPQVTTRNPGGPGAEMKLAQGKRDPTTYGVLKRKL